MVGGTVVEVVAGTSRVWVNVRDDAHPRDTCAVYLELAGVVVSPGDALWWQGEFCYWTPKANRVAECEHREHVTCRQKAGVDYDIPIRRVSYSGVERPAGHDIFDHEELTV